VTEYRLYLESGPRFKTTMVHVIGLLGCVANGPTTEAALEATPDEIRRYLRFCRDHGEDVDPRSGFTTVIAQHVTEGSWIGYGDPVPGFEPDSKPLTAKDERTYRSRFRALGEEITAKVGAVSARQLVKEPPQRRTIPDIVKHIGGAEPEYFRASNIGKPEGTKEALKALENAAPEDLAGRLEDLWTLLDSQLDQITPDIRNGRVQRGEKLWTARRGFRRILEHPWEHLREIERRLESV
jgi:hypothetical protein